mgnify:CR=1 FL=1
MNQERKPSLAEGYEAEIDEFELAQDLEFELAQDLEFELAQDLELETMIELLEE